MEETVPRTVFLDGIGVKRFSAVVTCPIRKPMDVMHATTSQGVEGGITGRTFVFTHGPLSFVFLLEFKVDRKIFDNLIAVRKKNKGYCLRTGTRP